MFGKLLNSSTVSSGVARDSSQGEAKLKGPTDQCTRPLANTSKKHFRNYGESGCGWLKCIPKSPEITP